MALEQIHILADMRVDAPAKDVWAIVGAFSSPALGNGFLLGVTGEGEGVGALRTLHLLPELGGGKVVERQTARDDRGYYYAYELDDPGVLPLVDYYASAQVAPVDEGRCRVIWLNRYKVEPVLVLDMRKQSVTLLEMIEANLKAELAARR